MQKYKIKIKGENILLKKSGDIALISIIFPVQFAYLIKNDEYCISLRNCFEFYSELLSSYFLFSGSFA